MKLVELRKELRVLREKHCPPVSKLDKGGVIREIERLKGTPIEHPKKLKVDVLEKLSKVAAETTARNVERKRQAIIKEATAAKAKMETEAKPKFGRHPKGSIEAKELMARVRASRK